MRHLLRCMHVHCPLPLLCLVHAFFRIRIQGLRHTNVNAPLIFHPVRHMRCFSHGTGKCGHSEIPFKSYFKYRRPNFLRFELAHLIPFRVTGLIPEILEFGTRYRLMSALFPPRNLAQKRSYVWSSATLFLNPSCLEHMAAAARFLKRVQQFAPHCKSWILRHLI